MEQMDALDTTISLKQPLSRALFIDFAIIGSPLKSLIFFLGMRLLPPLAGIMQMLIISKFPSTN
jgi:hypothetical protein